MRSLFGSPRTPLRFLPQNHAVPQRIGGWIWLLVCLVGGLLQAASLAWPLTGWIALGLTTGQPSGVLQIAALALLALSLQQASRPGVAFWRGWVFATAWLAGTFWWLFISLHTYGGLAAWLAVLAVLALAGALALYYAAGAGVLALLAPRSWVGRSLLFAALWTLAELMRGQWFTGFPWGAIGYAQVNTLAPWAPWVGVYGMGAIAALLACVIGSGIAAVVCPRRTSLAPHAAVPVHGGVGRVLRPGGLVMLASALALVLPGFWLPDGQRDTASAGTLRVWLLQGNIAQNEKFELGTGMAQALTWYPEQVAVALRAATASDQGPQLVVAPETALPLLPGQFAPDFWPSLLSALAQPGTREPVAVLLGLPLGNHAQGYTNSAWGLDAAAASRALAQTPSDALGGDAFYRYDKHHLVPFGEFIPPFFRWFIDLMNIPLGDFRRGALPQAPWSVAGQRLGTNICYEDLFGEELAASFRTPGEAPTVLVNLSNIAWFGDSIAIDQHLQISRLRALELGRPMLRATNTGATAVINHRGEVTHALPRLTRERLEAHAEGRSGTTPYARWAGRFGLVPLWAICLALVLVVGGWRWR